ncbi:NAD-dependent epimerase/dehydratase family protein [Geodermatophilus sp. YIM 151500]|uniref:NAD-dependent epimerase/dehydratase family protein n=1 Tax=Geodermatophilus sp. YIM 151500 TaxID=2984531 RepID=UPI0021E477AE|nr:NAD-dependent epimerase/dehydratase family protein [Geodermatophilus sp. YIM 151500]MCV2489357.1 NAD-dependent epimerase/dehydratase family protein [Geodermatophilus sp. YIM 151500]
MLDAELGATMRVLVTGGTGYVGAHSVRALVAAGHDVRLLVRDPGRIRPALDPLGVDPPEHVSGDVTDPAAVRRALDGCEAVLHAANVYALDSRRAREMAEVNVHGTELVLRTAHDIGLDPILHVSSYVALLPPPDGRPLSADSPVGRPAGPYSSTKAAAERVARRLQEEGAPVVVTNPGGVWGPHDPHLGDTARVAVRMLHGRLPVLPPGPMAVVDVRDVAAAHAAAMTPRRGPRRYLLVAEDVPFADLVGMVRRATGRRIPGLVLPLPVARPLIGARRRVPGSLEGPWYALQHARCDSSATVRELGVALRPAEESVRDTLRWLVQAGHVPARLAGDPGRPPDVAAPA